MYVHALEDLFNVYFRRKACIGNTFQFPHSFAIAKSIEVPQSYNPKVTSIMYRCSSYVRKGGNVAASAERKVCGAYGKRPYTSIGHANSLEESIGHCPICLAGSVSVGAKLTAAECERNFALSNLNPNPVIPNDVFSDVLLHIMG
jgi:hypothetical protein